MSRRKKTHQHNVVLPLPSESRIRSPYRHAVRTATIGLVVWFLACTGAGIMIAKEVKITDQFNFHGEVVA